MSPESLLDTRLRLRPDLLTSRGLLRGPTIVHLVKDPASGRAFEVGPREHFVMSRLDGTRTLAAIGEEYAAAYGRRLGEANWRQLLALLGSRGLFVRPAEETDAGSAGPPPAAAAGPATAAVTGPASAAGQAAVARAAPAAGRAAAVGGPSAAVRLVEGAYRLLRPVLHRWVIGPLVAVAGATLVLLLLRLDDLLDGGRWLVANPLWLIPVAALAWVGAALHELGHGVAARRYGCRVTRVSVVVLHCQVDGYLYLRSAGAQVAIAGAGGLVNALVLIPFAVAWWWLPEPAAVRPALAGLLLVGIAQTLVNYLPVPPLDGYKMLTHALGTTDLAGQSRLFLRLAAARLLRRGPGVAAYPRRARLTYTGYGLASLALVAGAVAAAVLAGRALTGGGAVAGSPAGDTAVAGFVVALVIVAMTVAGWLARPRSTVNTPTPEGGNDGKQ